MEAGPGVVGQEWGGGGRDAVGAGPQVRDAGMVVGGTQGSELRKLGRRSRGGRGKRAGWGPGCWVGLGAMEE